MTTIPATILMSQSFAPRISTKNHIMKISMPPEVSLAATKATSSRKTRKKASDFEPKTQSLFVKNANKTATIHARTLAGTTAIPSARVAIA